jgi:hypothetical protein
VDHDHITNYGHHLRIVGANITYTTDFIELFVADWLAPRSEWYRNGFVRTPACS